MQWIAKRFAYHISFYELKTYDPVVCSNTMSLDAW
jgi:hypothetical protein